MHTKESLQKDLRNTGLLPTDTVLIHASCKSIGEVEGRADTVLDALMGYFSEGLLILPAHTWSYIKKGNPVFDVRESKTCVGILTELFRKRSGVIRSLHPTHSLCAAGKGAKAFTDGQEKFDTPCAPGSCYGRLPSLNAKGFIIGEDFSCNTTVHCIEEVANVPNRITDAHEQLFVRDYDGRLIPVPSKRHDNANSDTYVRLEPFMYEQGLIKNCKFGDADCLLFDFCDLFDTALPILAANPGFFNE